MIDLLKYENKINKLFVFFAIFIFGITLTLYINSFYKTDDYSFVYGLKTSGVLENCISGYYNWDGRFLTLGGLAQAFCLKYLPIEWIVLFWSICFFVSGFFVYHIVNQEYKLELLTKHQKLFAMIVLPLLFWMGSFLHISETIYWGTGGVYSFFLITGAIWIYLFLKIQSSMISILSKILFFIFTLLVGASTQNMAIGLITLVLITLLIDFLQGTKTNNIVNSICLIILIAGIVYISTAPGNQNRINQTTLIKTNDFIIFYYIKNFFKTVFMYLLASSVLGVLTVLVGFALAVFLNPKLKIKLNFNFLKFSSKKDFIDFLETSKWFWVALSTATVFITIPEFVSRRTSIYFIFFMMIFVLITTLKTIKYFSATTIETNGIKRNLIFKNLILTSLLSILFIFSTYNFYKGYLLKKVVTARENQLKKGRNKTIYLKLIDPSLNSYCFQYGDFFINGIESYRFIIESQEKFFGTKIIVLKK